MKEDRIAAISHKKQTFVEQIQDLQQKELNLEKARTDLYLEAAITRLNTMAQKEHEEAIKDIEAVHE